MIMRLMFGGLLAAATVSGSALAADLPSRKAPVEVLPPPVLSWNGFYGGLNVGYGFGSGSQDPGYALTSLPATFGTPAWTIPNNLSGVLGGGQVGYNWRVNPMLVLGLEADLQASGLRSQGTGVGAGNGANAIPVLATTTLNMVFANQSKRVDWFGTVRARVGMPLPAFQNVMVYGTGGLAYGGVSHSANASDLFPGLNQSALVLTAFAPGVLAGAGSGYRSTRIGWTAGGGIEWEAFANLSFKLEYLYTSLGSTTVYGGPAGATVGVFAPAGPAPLAALSALGYAYRQTSATGFSTVRVGMNYHFNFGGAPVVAKY